MEALPLGTVRVRTIKLGQKVRQQRFVKASHHGSNRNRWRPFASHWWQQHVSPIPEGYQVYHRNGDPLDDDPSNLILVREDRFIHIFKLNPQSATLRQRRHAREVVRSNRRRAEIYRAQIRSNRFYAVLPESRAIVWYPCETNLAARRYANAEQLVKLCDKDLSRIIEIKGQMYAEEHSIVIVTGADLIRSSQAGGDFEGFIRLIPDTRPEPRKRRRTLAVTNLETAKALS